jgi:hypothetical protein
MNGYTSRIGMTVTMEIVYFNTFVFRRLAAAAAAPEPPALMMLLRFELVFR